MNAQSAKTPTPRESITITLTPDEQDFLIGQLDGLVRCQSEMPNQFHIEHGDYVSFVSRFHKKLRFLFQSGGACLHPVQPSDVSVQGGNQ